LIEIGSKGSGQSLALQAEEVEFLDPDLRFLLDREGRPFSRFYYNEVPQLASSVAKKIISQEKAKMLEPVLKGMIKEYLSGDGEIDQDEYLTLRLTAQSADVHDEELNQTISATRQEVGLSAEFEIIESHQGRDTGPHFKDWWIKYFLARQGIADLFEENRIATVRGGKAEEEGTAEYFHRLTWSEIVNYVTQVKEKYLDDETQNWSLLSNQWQQGKLTGYYWGRLSPENYPLADAYSISIFVRVMESASIVLNVHHQKLQRIIDKERSLALLEAATQILAEFLEENKKEISEFEVWIVGCHKCLVPQSKPEYTYFINELFPTLGNRNGQPWKRAYRLEEYYDKVHALAQNGDYIIYEVLVNAGVDKTSPKHQTYIKEQETLKNHEQWKEVWEQTGFQFDIANNPERIERAHRIGCSLFASVMSRIGDYAMENNIYFSEREGLTDTKYELVKPDLTEQIKLRLQDWTVDGAINADEYQQALEFVHQIGFRYHDFLKIKEEMQQNGIVFLDGSFINQLSPEQTQSMDSVLDRFTSQYQDQLAGLSDSAKRRQDLLQKSHQYSIRIKKENLWGLIGFRWTNTNQVYAIFQFEGHLNNVGQGDAFLEWVNQHPDWVSIEPDGSYRLHLHSGRKVFSIEKQEELPTWPWSEEQINQIVQVMAEMLPQWEEAKSQLVIEPPQSVASADTNDNGQPAVVNEVEFSPYQTAELEIDLADQALTEIPASQIADWIQSVVAVESPVPIPMVMWRICEAANIGRAGSKIQSAIEQAVEVAISSHGLEQRDGFLWLPEQSEVKARNRDPLSGRERNLDLICQQEVQAAITAVYEQPAVVTDLSAAAKQICRLLGFGRVSSEMEELLGQQIQQLQEQSN
jgi:hypothetical protein